MTSSNPSNPKVTALGGGHGLSASLQALRQITDQLVAVVTVADNGGSSGRLRRELGGLPPGDLRMALAALCGDNPIGRQWANVLQSRFHSSGPLDGHAIGNLLIEGIWQQLDAVHGLDMVADLLNVCGRVLPMSLEPLGIEADVIGVDPGAPDELSVVTGQHEVAVTKGDVVAVRLVPGNPVGCPEAIASIRDADYLVLGPGSWFTSVLPHLLVPELADAVINSPAHRVLTLNIEADSETKGINAAQHLDILAEHAPKLRFDTVIVDAGFDADDQHLRTFARVLGADLVVADVRCHDGTARHDPTRLAQVFSRIMGC
ncbi:uridine diphosphate-N-acetylglucosamine-binding protein YvcK [Propionimicrobium sp. PCR01-08-3]|uniref:gluconeogenesis factor YvcK family protein n=1 Tax=Propionimicrobium sp. PCR01-08-3 TaxID=3052086 RepID=UPI00255C8ACF|nr:uridine diphosphate-N-acetylglucosamine-binding protein YvcK [Propionimicrobium sp. PCR01-08-3]WIY81622.1 uridine diphosphate-N-acetylglucosamine-binding protein YvcK [Propionimicrobium sp. PCR01-08-3]